MLYLPVVQLVPGFRRWALSRQNEREHGATERRLLCGLVADMQVRAVRFSVRASGIAARGSARNIKGWPAEGS